MNFVCCPRAIIMPSLFFANSTSRNANFLPHFIVFASTTIVSPGNADLRNLEIAKINKSIYSIRLRNSFTAYLRYM